MRQQAGEVRESEPADEAAGPAAAGASARLGVLFLTENLDGGGAERQLVSLAAGLAGAGHRVAIAALRPEGAFAAEARAAGVGLVDLGRARPGGLAAAAVRLRRTVRARRPDVLYAVQPAACLLALAAKPALAGGRLVWGVVAADLPGALYPWRTRLAFALAARLSARADAVVVNSERGRAWARAGGYPAGRLAVIANGFDLAAFRPDPAGGRRLRAAWGVPAGARLVGLPGRIDPVKGHGDFLRAAAALVAERDDLRFVCIGSGAPGLAAELRALAERLGLGGRLTWAGRVDDMAAAYSALDLACLASLSEGLPNVVGEAMACGVPCVVTDVGDAARLVGGHGVVVPPGDAGALAGGLRQALARLDGEGFGDPRARIAAGFPRAALIRRTEALLAGLAAGGPA